MVDNRPFWTYNNNINTQEHDMKAMIIFMLGLVTAAAGVGGVEHSITDSALIQSTLIAVVGLALMLIATSYINNDYHQRIN